MTHALPPVFSLPGWCTVWSCSTVFTCIQLRYSSAWRPMIVLGTLPFLALRVPCKYHLITLQNSPGKKSYTSSQKQLLKTRIYILQWDSVLYVNAHKILPPPQFLFWRSNQWASNFKKPSKQARKQARVKVFMDDSQTCLFYKLTLNLQITVAWCDSLWSKHEALRV